MPSLYSVCSIIHLSKSDCREPNIEEEPEPEIQSITDPFTVKVEADPEPSVLSNLMFFMSQGQKLLLS